MPRGQNNNNNHGRGNGSGEGRGRGYRGRGRSNGRGRGGSGHPDRNNYLHSSAELDPVIQQWEAEPLDAGGSVNRGNGPWRGWMPRSGAGTPLRGASSPRRGTSTPRGAGRGRGRGRGGDHSFDDSRRPWHAGLGAQKETGYSVTRRAHAPLSDLLSRPLLRPVKFVRATLTTPFLFEKEEELLNAVSEEVGTTEDSHVPTADNVARVFSGAHRPFPLDSEPEGKASNRLEEIDFADLGRFRAEVDAVAGVTHEGPQEEIQEIDFTDLAMIRAEVDAAVPAAKPQAPSQDLTVEEVFTGVYNIKDTIHLSSSRDVDVEQKSPSASLPTGVAEYIQVLQQGIEVLDASTNLASAEARDVLVMAKETSSSSTASMDTPMAPPQEDLSISPPHLHATSSTPAASLPEPDTPLQKALSPSLAHLHATSNVPAASSPEPDAPPTDDVSPLFVIDTKPTRPFAKRPASEVILVDRTGRGETLGEEDELIVYVAPHPRSGGRVSPTPELPRVKLPTSSVLTGKSSISTSGIRSSVRQDDDANEGISNDVAASRDQTRPEPPSIPSISLNFSSPAPSKQPRTRPVFTPSERSKAVLKARTKEKRIQRNKGRSAFASFGVMLSEARLREEDERDRRHPRWETRRRDDSDVDWGTGTDEEEGEERRDGIEVDDEMDEVSDGLGGMDVDPDLKLEVNAMKGFVQSMSSEGSRFRTIDDIEDEARMRQEDEGGASGPAGSSDSGSDDSDEEGEEDGDGEEEMVFNVEEEILIAESGDEVNHPTDDEDGEDTSEDSSDDDGKRSPGSAFQARLRKVRGRYQGKLSEAAQEISDDDDSHDKRFAPRTQGAENRVLLAQLEDILEEHSQILTARDREQMERLVHELTDTLEFSTPAKRKKGKGKEGYFAAELQDQWEKDRAKKAEYKRKRAEARLLAALDPSSPKKGGRKARKAMRAAFELDPEAASSMAIVDMTSVEAQMRQFMEDIGGEQTLALPPMGAASRKVVHEFAHAFNLKSESKGDGVERYTTLTKTTKTGTEINENKVKALRERLRKMLDHACNRKEGKGRKGKGKVKVKVKGEVKEREREKEKGKEKEKEKRQIPRHRDGDEVGKAAPKIGQGNIGFKMLASMGWSEGDRIGGTTSAGIEVPLTVIIKNSKLGLGATQSTDPHNPKYQRR
ncbi:hypothetical protein PAXRUDRAFT_420075 [Paxillus rubicundulus Ve08.2h10]|uniref:Protein SQS1 n=1 Tax=Paxillus rubicundulus Ve08.2h10 TaxID=930991 RepID=A0A0D0E8E8_9AGAM|nr:hypothetical protein PAXRUDRAFT_420075 [Paxillus rubicundulus Ve08.2h10]